jgi:hypothetical protein
MGTDSFVSSRQKTRVDWAYDDMPLLLLDRGGEAVDYALSASKFIILIDKRASFKIRRVLSDGNEMRIPKSLEGRCKCEQ